MLNAQGETAPYKVIADAGGKRYRFYCESSGMAVYMTEPIRADTPQEELALAWLGEARKHFNRCASCGKWVSDMMFNVDAVQCVDCAPWQEKFVFCSKCGARLSGAKQFCPNCGAKLLYEGGVIDG